MKPFFLPRCSGHETSSNARFAFFIADFSGPSLSDDTALSCPHTASIRSASFAVLWRQAWSRSLHGIGSIVALVPLYHSRFGAAGPSAGFSDTEPESDLLDTE